MEIGLDHQQPLQSAPRAGISSSPPQNRTQPCPVLILVTVMGHSSHCPLCPSQKRILEGVVWVYLLSPAAGPGVVQLQHKIGIAPATTLPPPAALSPRQVQGWGLHGPSSLSHETS